VHHRSAAVADAISTALYAASPHELEALVAPFGGAVVWATDADGRAWNSPPITGAPA
jgi:thiamine biosynthesis lipoprotein